MSAIFSTNGLITAGTIAAPQSQGFALLVYLALTRTPQPREQLAALFWPDRDVAAARNVVRTTLRRLRRHLAAAGGTTVAALTLLRGERDALGREGVGLARDGTPRRRGAARPRHRARPAPWRLATGGARPG